MAATRLPNHVAGHTLGLHAPDLPLHDPEGKEVRLSRLFRGSPVLLLLLDTCDHTESVRQLLEFRDQTLALEREGIRIVAVSTDEPSRLAYFRRERGIAFPILSDAGARLGASLGLSSGVSIRPAALLLDAQRLVRKRWPGGTLTARELVAFVRRGGAKSTGTGSRLLARLARMALFIGHALQPKRLVR